MISQEQKNCLFCGNSTSKYMNELVDDRYGYPGKFDIYQCLRCDHMFTMPRLKDNELPALYQNYYPRNEVDYNDINAEVLQNSQRSAGIKRWLKGTNNQGQFFAKKGQKVLDIGCGSCHSLLDLKQKGAVGYGVEADPNVALIADHYGLNVHIGEISDGPFPGVKFDLIVMNQVLEHLPDPETSMKVISQRLAKKGKLVLAFPNAGSFYLKLSGKKWINWHVPYHQQFFTKKSITVLARKLGLSVEKMSTVTPSVWTGLQYKSMFANIEEGSASLVWSPNPTGIKKLSLSQKIKNKIQRILKMFFYPAITLFNRIIDLFGQGDCLVVVIKNDTPN